MARRQRLPRAPRSSPRPCCGILAASAHRPGARGHAARPPRRPRPQARARRRSRRSPASSGCRCSRRRASTSPARSRPLRASGATVGTVCAFGQLIGEPLLERAADAQRAPVAAAALARGGADRAGDHGRRRRAPGSAVMRLTEGLDSGPVALREELPIDAGDTYGDAGAAARPARRRDARPGPRPAGEPARSSSSAQDEEGVTYAEKIERRRPAPRPGAAGAASSSSSVRALTPHIGAFFELDGGERLGVRAAPSARRSGARRAGSTRGRRRRAARRLRDGRARDHRAAAARQAGDGRRRLAARARAPARAWAPLERADAGPPRRLRGPAPRLRARRLGRPRLRSAVERHRLEGRERAQAQHLAYGAVQRRGTTDHLVALLAGRKPQKIDPPLLAALRLGALRAALRRRRRRPRGRRSGRRARQGRPRRRSPPSRRRARQRRPAARSRARARRCSPALDDDDAGGRRDLPLDAGLDRASCGSRSAGPSAPGR